MIILDDNNGWDNKVNFVDGNNVVLGYDLTQDCCENADWFISDKVEKKPEGSQDKSGLDAYIFDVDFYETVSDGPGEWDFDDGGGMSVFRITDGSSEKFIHLYNIHNGYYSHGFSLEVGGKTIREEYI